MFREWKTGNYDQFAN